MADGDVQELRNRHLAIMDLMLVRPELNQNQVAEALHYSPNRLSAIVNSPLFQMAFRERRRQVEVDLRGAIVEATAAAIKFSKDTLESSEVPVPIKQISASAILAQGHARAVEKSARLTMEAEVPKEMFGALMSVMKEMDKPFQPSRILERPDEKEAVEVGVEEK